MIKLVSLPRKYSFWKTKEGRKKKKGWVRVLGFQNEMTFLPSLIKNDHFVIGHTESTCHSIKKYNVVNQKMHIACNFKAWRVHCSILNSMGQCAKHDIGWGVKCNQTKIIFSCNFFTLFDLGC